MAVARGASDLWLGVLRYESTNKWLVTVTWFYLCTLVICLEPKHLKSESCPFNRCSEWFGNYTILMMSTQKMFFSNKCRSLFKKTLSDQSNNLKLSEIQETIVSLMRQKNWGQDECDIYSDVKSTSKTLQMLLRWVDMRNKHLEIAKK